MIPDKLDLASAKPPSVLVKPDPVIVAADPGAMLVTPIPCMLLPPSTPPTAVGNFPRVVVVNPTPHPTPPATPVLTGPAPPIPSSAQHLAPPPRLSAAVTRQRTPDATIPSNPAPALPSISSPPQLPARVPVAVATQVATPQPQPQPQPQLLRLQPQPQRPVEDTLKPSDRRFFLQQDQSPSPERDVQDLGSNGSISTGKSPSETGELQPSSVTSDQTRASAASASSHPTGRGRRSRNAPTRPTMARFNSSRHVVQVTRKEAAKARTAVPHAKADKAAATKVAGSSRQQRSSVEPQPPPPPKVQAQQMNGAADVAPKGVNSNPDGTRAGAGATRRGIVVSNSSSEFETTDTDDDDEDDSWASEDISEGGAETAGIRPTDKRSPTKEEIRLREAVVEAQRQRDLFVKQPKRSYSNLGRTQSGLLSQLLNPDPTVLPPGRPYRVSSTHDIARPNIPPTLTSGKSSAAVPQAAQITAQAPMGAATSSGHSNGKVNGSGGGGMYRPKGRPQGEELEDESDSPDDPDDTIQVSHSLAQQRLAALANPARRRASDNQVPQQAPVMGARPLLQSVATAPIPLNHPWNLPTPAPPTTPRTTRRQMLATELSESLRRNLLWERQVSKTNLLGTAGRRNGGGGTGGGGGLRMAVAVNVSAQAGPSQQQPQRRQQQQQQQQPPPRQAGSAGPGEGAPVAAVEDNVAERRRRALARNRTWDDFHYFGW